MVSPVLWERLLSNPSQGSPLLSRTHPSTVTKEQRRQNAPRCERVLGADEIGQDVHVETRETDCEKRPEVGRGFPWGLRGKGPATSAGLGSNPTHRGAREIS